MSSIALKVTRAPSTTGVHDAPQGVKPLFRGNGDTDYVCGNCASICPACGAENEFPLELRA